MCRKSLATSSARSLLVEIREDKDMENYSRVSMLIPFSEYQQKIGEKPKKDPVPDFEGGGNPKCIIGPVYPDLGSQAAYINRDIQKAKEGICQAVTDIFDLMGEEAVNIAIESMYDFTTGHLSLGGQNMKEDCGFTWKGLSDLEDGIYYRKELAKNLFSLYLKNNRLRDLDYENKLTQQGILL